MNEKKYADGVRFFERKDNQPDFVLGALVITPGDLSEWAINNPDLTSNYKGKAQVKFQVKRSKDGKIYIELDTYKPGNRLPDPIGPADSDNLPF